MSLQALQASALSPAQKAWVTRRAKMAAASMVANVPALKAVAEHVAKPAIVHRSSNADFAAPRVYVEPELVDVAEFAFVSLYLVDHPVVGNGQREFVPLALSSKKVRLFYPPSLETIEVSREVYDRGFVPVPSRRYSRARIAERIRQRIALADRVNGEEMAMVLQDGGREAQRVLELIGADHDAAQDYVAAAARAS